MPAPLMGPGVPPPYHPLAPTTYYQEKLALAAPMMHSPEVPEAPATQAQACACTFTHAKQPVTHLDFSIPKNSGIIGTVVTCSSLQLPTNITFADFWDWVCAHMDLDPAEAELGYKFSTGHVRDVPRTLANEKDLATAIENGQGLVHQARTHKIEMMIHNLKPATILGMNTKKQKEPAGVVGEPLATLDFTNKLHQLKEHLACITHTGRWCFVSPIDGHHQQLDIFVLTLWVKKMLLNKAMITQPPNILQFDHPTKRRRTSQAHVADPSGATPTIHLHLGDLPFNDQASQRCLNLASHETPLLLQSSPSDSNDDNPVTYPLIEVFFVTLIKSCPCVKDLSLDFLVNQIGMPRGVVANLQRHAAHLTCWAEKGKGQAEVINLTEIQKQAHSKKENVN
ncbi:hypothetical protein HYDPIDRAFT_165949 [Hydnomerulius pinastri MD-312]|nr:hypothetical protein HYDPIDRAFT_165949 [Hydnomerulius pinastri MD-312]